jgi:hypothetical protein
MNLHKSSIQPIVPPLHVLERPTSVCSNSRTADIHYISVLYKANGVCFHLVQLALSFYFRFNQIHGHFWLTLLWMLDNGIFEAWLGQDPINMWRYRLDSHLY